MRIVTVPSSRCSTRRWEIRASAGVHSFGMVLSFDALRRRGDAPGSFVQDVLGIKPGDRVVVMVRNRLQSGVAVYGILCAVAVVVNVNRCARRGNSPISNGARAIVVFAGATRALAEVVGDVGYDTSLGHTTGRFIGGEAAGDRSASRPRQPRSAHSPHCGGLRLCPCTKRTPKRYEMVTGPPPSPVASACTRTSARGDAGRPRRGQPVSTQKAATMDAKTAISPPRSRHLTTGGRRSSSLAVCKFMRFCHRVIQCIYMYSTV